MKKLLIAHRGNVNGPNHIDENNPEYINVALDNGYDVEVDVWLIDNEWWLGHDSPQYKVDYEFFTTKMWLHCKNYNALQELSRSGFNCFYHTDEDYVLTSFHWIWAYPGQSGGKNTICVMPEYTNQSVNEFSGICSDFVEKYK